MVDLTKRQREIFDYIGKYADKMGYPPTVREIGKAVGLHSSSTVHVHLANLEKAGVLRRDPSKPRALEILVEKAKSARDATVDAVENALPGNGPGLPLLGRISAGTGMLAEENIEDYVEVPAVIGGQDGDYVLEVRGESMKNAGIMDGDYVIVHPTPEARNGEIVVAMLDEEEATVKRLFKETDHMRLQPENDEFEPIISTDAQVIGKVIGCFRAI
ncbi:MAG TPA: transcriptional repressor LexA [Solirubrobacterales bacterium]|nr:transcriptional repressor LexA [Solirubrobacterales bacterium]